MKKSIFAVCDLEASYAYNLMEAIDERQGMSFEVQAFTNVESLISYARERHIELLLISAAAMCGELLKLSIGKIMILSEGEKKRRETNGPPTSSAIPVSPSFPLRMTFEIKTSNGTAGSKE